MVYEPKMVKGECLPDGTDFEWCYFCHAQDAMVPLSLSYCMCQLSMISTWVKRPFDWLF